MYVKQDFYFITLWNLVSQENVTGNIQYINSQNRYKQTVCNK